MILLYVYSYVKMKGNDFSVLYILLSLAFRTVIVDTTT